MGGWQAQTLRSNGIIFYSTISHYEPLVETVAAPVGLQHQCVGDGRDVGSLGVAGYGAGSYGTGTDTMAWWNNGMATMERARWHRRDGPGTGTLAQARWHSKCTTTIAGHNGIGVIRQA